MSAEGLSSRQVGARTLVLAAIVASTMMRVVAMASSLPRIAMGTPTGVEGVMRVKVAAETLMYQDCGAQHAVLWRLVD